MANKICLLICLLVCISFGTKVNSEDIIIGGLFDVEDDELNVAFLHAIESVNNEKILYPHKLVGVGQQVSTDNEFLVSRTVCTLFNTGVVGIFGSTTGRAADYVQSMCDDKKIPHIKVRYDVQQQRDSLMINLYPYPPVLAKVYVDIIRAWHWKSFTVLYENFHELPHIIELLKMYDQKGYAVNIRQMDGDRNGNYRPVLTEAKKAGETHFVLECHIENLEEILTQAQQVGLLSDSHNYIIMHPDMHTINLTPYQYGGANITGIRLVDPENMDVVRVSMELHERKMTYNDELLPDRHPQIKFRSKTALLYDAVYLFAMAFKDLNRRDLVGKPLFCNATDNWEHGYSLINFMKTKTLRGLTGEIKFDHQGFRTDFLLEIIKLHLDGLQKVGTWNSTEELNIIRPELLPEIIPEIFNSTHDDESLVNKTFVVLISLSEPYNMLKNSSEKLMGNARFEGFSIDLIRELADMLGFKFTFKLYPNYCFYGVEKKQEWTGMIKKLMEQTRYLDITDLTITSERETEDDFKMLFMNLGFNTYKKPMAMPSKLLFFTSPFSVRVWTWLGGAYFFVSIALFVVGRISPADWTNPFPCVKKPKHLYHRLSIKNCFWFTLSSLMQQGFKIVPIGIGTKMIAGLWWFFTLIFISHYIANLIAILRVENTLIKNIGHTTYIGNYMLLMESTDIVYTIERFCDLTQVGGWQNNRKYEIAMSYNSTYRNELSAAVYRLLYETDRLAVLTNKWSKEVEGDDTYFDNGDSDVETGLPYRKLEGVFLILGAGSVLAIIVAIIEMLIGVCNRSKRNEVPFKEELATELKFFFSCKGQAKANTCRKSTSPVENSKSLTSLHDNISPSCSYS